MHKFNFLLPRMSDKGVWVNSEYLVQAYVEGTNDQDFSRELPSKCSELLQQFLGTTDSKIEITYPDDNRITINQPDLETDEAIELINILTKLGNLKDSIQSNSINLQIARDQVLDGDFSFLPQNLERRDNLIEEITDEIKHNADLLAEFIYEYESDLENLYLLDESIREDLLDRLSELQSPIEGVISGWFNLHFGGSVLNCEIVSSVNYLTQTRLSTLNPLVKKEYAEDKLIDPRSDIFFFEDLFTGLLNMPITDLIIYPETQLLIGEIISRLFYLRDVIQDRKYKQDRSN